MQHIAALAQQSTTRLRLNIVKHLALRFHQDRHVQENLMQPQQLALQVLHRARSLCNLLHCVEHLRVAGGAA